MRLVYISSAGGLSALRERRHINPGGSGLRFGSLQDSLNTVASTFGVVITINGNDSRLVLLDTHALNEFAKQGDTAKYQFREGSTLFPGLRYVMRHGRSRGDGLARRVGQVDLYAPAFFGLMQIELPGRRTCGRLRRAGTSVARAPLRAVMATAAAALPLCGRGSRRKRSRRAGLRFEWCR